jgi:superoxide reductase
MEQRSVYYCAQCGNIVEVDFVGGGTLVCCGEPMKLLEVKTADYATEKHVPYIEKQAGGVLVKVGKETAHPMNPDHYIVLIKICADGVMMTKYLKPGDKPEAFFKTDAKKIVAWEICNKHGVWKSNQ